MNERGGKTTKKTCNDLGICMPKVFSSGRIHGFRGRQDKHLENPLSITEQTNHGRLKKKKKYVSPGKYGMYSVRALLWVST